MKVFCVDSPGRRVETQGPGDLLLARCHRNLAEETWQYVRSIVGGARRDVPGGFLIRCDLPSHTPNIAYRFSSDTPGAKFLDEARDFFGPKRLWRLIASAPGAGGLDPGAEGLGLRPVRGDPGLLLDPIPPAPGPTPGLVVRPVEDRSTLADFATVWCRAFRIPQWIAPIALPGIPPDDPEHKAQNRAFLGYADGKPVACSTVTVTERVAGIANVGTLPSVRGRGYGAALTGRAIDAGRELGADVAYLAASDMGLPLYARMGFRRVSEYHYWQIPVGFFASIRALRAARRLARASAPG